MSRRPGVKRWLGAWALALARSRLGRWLIGRLFESTSFALPVRRLRETQTLLAFHHPQPAYPLHILIVPRKALGGLGDLGPADAAFMQDLFAAVKSLGHMPASARGTPSDSALSMSPHAGRFHLRGGSLRP